MYRNKNYISNIDVDLVRAFYVCLEVCTFPHHCKGCEKNPYSWQRQTTMRSSKLHNDFEAFLRQSIKYIIIISFTFTYR